MAAVARPVTICRRDNHPAPPIFTDRRLDRSQCFPRSSTFAVSKVAERPRPTG